MAYVHPRDYPSTEVNALQAIQMAAALSEITDLEFFIPKTYQKAKNLKKKYDVGESLKIKSMNFQLVPDFILKDIPDYFEKAVAANVQMKAEWRDPSKMKVLFVRDPKELLYWARQKKENPFFRDWVFVFEGHSTIGLLPNKEGSNPVFIAESEDEKRYATEVMECLKAFDIVLCVTQSLANALQLWTNGEVIPYLIRHASPLSRVEQPPEIKFGEKIILGYAGQISQYKGVNVIFEALRYLPGMFEVRIFGGFHKRNSNRDWIDLYKQDSLLSNRIEIRDAVPIGQVAQEIDSCDILIQPASTDIRNTNFEAPLKSFDYMVRGKPIIIADVPCHRELYRDGENGLLYDTTAEDLAKKILTLASNPNLASKIACGAWDQSVEYDYLVRANKILSQIVHSCWNSSNRTSSGL